MVTFSINILLQLLLFIILRLFHVLFFLISTFIATPQQFHVNLVIFVRKPLVRMIKNTDLKLDFFMFLRERYMSL